MKCTVCEEVKRGSMINQLPNGMNICDTCLEDGEEELDLNDPHNIDEDTMQKALNLTKDKREVEN